MTANEMMDKINSKAEEKLNAKLSKEDAVKESIKRNLKTILRYRKKLKDLAPVVARLVSARLCQTSDDMHKNYADHRKRGYFMADAWFHWVGYSIRSFSFWGISGGGYEGNGVFLDLDTNKFLFCDMYDEACTAQRYGVDEMVEQVFSHKLYRNCFGWSDYDTNMASHIKKMAENVTKFIDEVNAYVEKL